MMSRRLLTGVLILLLATLPLAGPVSAAPHYPQLLIAKNDHGNNGDVSLDEAVAQARRQHNGKVLAAETVRKDGRKEHRIKILTKDGRVKRTRIDACSEKKQKKKNKNKSRKH